MTNKSSEKYLVNYPTEELENMMQSLYKFLETELNDISYYGWIKTNCAIVKIEQVLKGSKDTIYHELTDSENKIVTYALENY